MLQPHEMPQDLATCQALALDLAAKCETLRTTLTAQVSALQKQLAERADEYEKMRKLLSHFINGRRSEKVVRLDSRSFDVGQFDRQRGVRDHAADRTYDSPGAV